MGEQYESELMAAPRALTRDEIECINDIHKVGNRLGEIVEFMKSIPDFDQRWVAIGGTHIQQGIMALERSIAKPTDF